MPRCPSCGWTPNKSAKWQCNKCNTIFNTFETGGICPQCGEFFKKTQCLFCGACYPFEDWYEEDDFFYEKIKKREDDDVTIFGEDEEFRI
ncbi:MAG: hypothetical protein ACTSRP_12690 [Candidatus Helarchaeota archaeon]